MTITVGQDSYTTVAEADAYFNETLKAADWAAVGDKKEICLKMACRKMEPLHYTGYKAVSTQPLEFPRHWAAAIPAAIQQFINDPQPTPEDIKHAQAELALWIYQNQNNQILKLQQMGLKSMSMSNESYSFSDSGAIGPTPCIEANEFLNKWLERFADLC